MKHTNSHCNQIDDSGPFIKIKCSLTIKQVAKLCFRNVRTVTQWNLGKRQIPPECVRLIRCYECREIGIGDAWQGFKMVGEKLILPNGEAIGPQQIIIAVGILQISAPNDSKYASKIIKYARSLATMKAKIR